MNLGIMNLLFIVQGPVRDQKVRHLPRYVLDMICKSYQNAKLAELISPSRYFVNLKICKVCSAYSMSQKPLIYFKINIWQ